MKNQLRVFDDRKGVDMGQGMGWILYASAAAVALAAADVFVKLAAGKVSNSVGVLIYGSCTFSMGLAWFLWQKINRVPQHAQISGLLAAIGVGVAFALVTFALYATFQAGAPISLVSPLIRLGGLLIASVVGLLLWREPLTFRYVIGIVLAGSGVYLIITR
jgi:drug/metabolite transporter (DMT)-like permease